MHDGSSKRGKPYSVLLVDDDESFLYLLEDLLALDYNVSTAGDILEAVALLQLHQFDLVLIDLNLPILHAIELIQALRSQRGSRPILAISDYPRLETLVERHMVEAILAKPFHRSDLQQVIGETLLKDRQPATIDRVRLQSQMP